jgi:hypothetical protein
MGAMYGSAASDGALSVSETSQSAILAYEQRMQAKLKVLLASEEALKKVTIAPADVELLVGELGWQKPLAERVLRLAGGNLKALIRSLCD